jgi:tRNA (adenine57-N1/adenine58-N1)-methyltransferase catalytic subunit
MTNSDDSVREGDSVILYFSMTTIVLIPGIEPNGSTHNACGFFQHSDIIGKQFGSRVYPQYRSENPRPAYIMRVTPELFTLSIPHRTQIIYHADISTILMGLDVRPGCVVAEAGTGSASLSFSIASALAPTGKLFTFEIDESRAEHNRSLLKSVVTPGDVVVLEKRDVVTLGFPECISVDAVFLDLPSPWLAIGNAHAILKPNGRICTFSPSVEQVARNVAAMKELGFHEIKTVEVMLKPWGLDVMVDDPTAGEKRKRTTNSQFPRQSFQLPMRGHTSYLTFAIKGLGDERDFPKAVLKLSDLSKQIEQTTNS